MSSQSFRPNSPPIIQETIDQETIMVNLETGSYYSLNPTGSHIWAAMENGVHTDELAPDLAERFAADVTSVEPDVRGFIDRLVQEELIVPRSDVSPASTVTNVAPPPPPAAYEPPTLHHYTDMQELLLLDPVHEVDAAGWPAKR